MAPSASKSVEFGRYRLLQKIGEGGMGEVWLAEQPAPIRRQVALKIIKAGMDTAHVVARFEAERQALAVMDHPAIAKVFDAGATPQGRPYFVMEYVRGEPITTYCARQRLSTRERLDLFLQVCDGVQHAHQKGIIHRDLKPSNILVTLLDGSPVPKIIDFGVAKATAQPLTDRTLYTELGALIGTPEYMSPEQAEMSAIDIDTRTDVYALGVTLYELLTGVLPFDSKLLRESGLDAIRRTIREVEPPRPSTRVTQADTPRAGNSAADRAALGRELRGDLDCITMRAIEKDRTRRYGSAAEFASDVRRHLEGLPVAASPPSAIYRARKFVQRHRLPVAAALLLAIAVLGGLLATTTMYLRAEGARRESDARRIEAERQRARADQERDRAETQRRLAQQALAQAEKNLGLLVMSAVETSRMRNPHSAPGRSVALRSRTEGVQVLSFGAEPRSVLRFDVPREYRQTADLQFTGSMQIDAGGLSMPEMILPTMTMRLDAAVSDVTAAGDIIYTITFSGLSIAPDAAQMVMPLTMIGLNPADRLQTTVVMDRYGVRRSSKLEVKSAQNSAFAQIVRQNLVETEALFTAFPEQPIGIGARWAARRVVDLGIIRVPQRIECELVGFESRVATLRTRIEQTFPPDARTELSAGAIGATVRMVEGSGSGNGTKTLRLTDLMGSGEANVDTISTIETIMNGALQRMKGRTMMRIAITPRKPPE